MGWYKVEAPYKRSRSQQQVFYISAKDHLGVISQYNKCKGIIINKSTPPQIRPLQDEEVSDLEKALRDRHINLRQTKKTVFRYDKDDAPV